MVLLTLSILSPVKSFAACTNGGNPTDPGDCSFLGAGTNNPPSGDAQGILAKISSILSSVIPILVALGVVYMVWGIVQYVIADSEEAKGKGRDRIIFGIIGLAVIVSVWGLVAIFINTFGLDKNNKAPTHDQLKDLLPR